MSFFDKNKYKKKASRSGNKPHFRIPYLVGFVPFNVDPIKLQSKKWFFIKNRQSSFNLYKEKGIFFANLPIKKYYAAVKIKDKRLYRYLSGNSISCYNWSLIKNLSVISLNKKDQKFFQRLGIKPNWRFFKKWKLAVNIESRLDIILSYVFSPFHSKALIGAGLVSVQGRIVNFGSFRVKNISRIYVSYPFIKQLPKKIPPHIKVTVESDVVILDYTTPTINWLFFSPTNVFKSWSSFLFNLFMKLKSYHSKKKLSNIQIAKNYLNVSSNFDVKTKQLNRLRCCFSGKSRSVFKKLRISRIVFRSKARHCMLPGISKKSWLFRV